jgi:hypothetical protein
MGFAEREGRDVSAQAEPSVRSQRSETTPVAARTSIGSRALERPVTPLCLKSSYVGHSICGELDASFHLYDMPRVCPQLNESLSQSSGFTACVVPRPTRDHSDQSGCGE